MKNIIFLCLVCVLSVQAREWDSYNDPTRFDIDATKNSFNSAIKKQSGEVDFEKANWSGYHWPTKNQSLKYIPPGQEMGPLQKWEKAGGDYDLRSHVQTYIDNNMGSWGGFCHGYSAASISFKEPTKKTINGVTFYHSDIKGLLAVYYDYLVNENRVSRTSIGRRCIFSSYRRGKVGSESVAQCDDINPGAFHLAITNKLHKQGKGFVMDMDPTNQVWNVPVVGYSSEILGEFYQSPESRSQLNNLYSSMVGKTKTKLNKINNKFETQGFLERDDWNKKDSYEKTLKQISELGLEEYMKYKNKAPGTTKVYHIKTKLNYLTYQKPHADSESKRGKAGQELRTMDLEYTLEVNKDNIIIGGEWLSNDHPDFLWYPRNVERPSGEWELLNQLLN